MNEPSWCFAWTINEQNVNMNISSCEKLDSITAKRKESISQSAVRPVYTVKESVLTIIGVFLLAILLVVILNFTVSNATAASKKVLPSEEATLLLREVEANNSFYNKIAYGSDLANEQLITANWLAKKYRVSKEALTPVVSSAWIVGEQKKLDPRLLLAVAAIESRFNPLAQSDAGAQGLMQVMTRVHKQRYASFGGVHKAFDPLVNLEIGADILSDCAKQRHSVQGALNCYVGGDTGGSYPRKVLNEYNNLIRVSGVPAMTMFVPIYPKIVVESL